MNRVQLHVKRLSQLTHVAAVTRRFAARCGLSARAQWEVATVAAELASNAVKHGGGGLLCLEYRRVGPTGRAQIEVITRDRGPFVGDPETAPLDGYSKGEMRPGVWLGRSPKATDSTRPSLGCGLGAVKRLSDELEIVILQDGSTQVSAIKHSDGGHSR
jgi:serine/threonine-protein kinase RsbT